MYTLLDVSATKLSLVLQFPVRNVLWALQDSVVIFTCGPHVYTLKVDHSLPTLESLCRHTIMSKIIGEGEDTSVELLPLPKRVVSQLSRSNEPVIPVSFGACKST